eukprot:evm.model.scf_275.3 EVM.evm.TU.scf_275.3   scf_275:59844-61109(-)
MATGAPDGPPGWISVPSLPIAQCLACDICGDILRDPHTCLLCLHSYCYECIRACVTPGSYGNTCPVGGCGTPDITGQQTTKLGSYPFDEKKQTIRHDATLNEIIKRIFPRPGLDERLEAARAEREARIREGRERARAPRRNFSGRSLGHRDGSGGCLGPAASRRVSRSGASKGALAGRSLGIDHEAREPGEGISVPAVGPVIGGAKGAGPAPGAGLREVHTLRSRSADAERKAGKKSGGQGEWRGSAESRLLRQTADRAARRSLERGQAVRRGEAPQREAKPGAPSSSNSMKRRSSDLSNCGSTGRNHRHRAEQAGCPGHREGEDMVIAIFPSDFFHAKRALPPLEFNYFRLPCATPVAEVGRIVLEELHMEEGVDLFCMGRRLGGEGPATLVEVRGAIWEKQGAEEELLTLYYAAKGAEL